MSTIVVIPPAPAARVAVSKPPTSPPRSFTCTCEVDEPGRWPVAVVDCVRAVVSRDDARSARRKVNLTRRPVAGRVTTRRERITGMERW